MYTTLIFDLDDTLTDDFENTKQAFKCVLNYRNEEYSDEKFLKFREIDKKTWRDRASGKLVSPFENDKVKKTEWVRASRFIKYYNEENISYEDAVVLNNIYMEGMKEKVVSREGTIDVIKYLYDKDYRIIIATNGPVIPLEIKIKKIGISDYVDLIFSAEEVGFMKPFKQYYDGLLDKAQIESRDSILFIGDDLEKDVKGGIENGLDTCWCNYDNSANDKYETKYEIHELKELMDIL